MENRLIVLELVLKELDMEPTINSLDDRIRLQKAIYLSQEAGVPLGYRFSWYVRGPYSPGLTSDYYSLEVASNEDSEGKNGKRLRPDIRRKLCSIKPMMSVPSTLLNDLDRTMWLELVSSTHYLLKTIGKNDADKARSRLMGLKPKLAPFLNDAESELLRAGLNPGTAGT